MVDSELFRVGLGFVQGWPIFFQVCSQGWSKVYLGFIPVFIFSRFLGSMLIVDFVHNFVV